MMPKRMPATTRLDVQTKAHNAIPVIALDTAMARQRDGEVEQRLVAAGPADERQTDRAAGNGAGRDRHLR